MKNKLPGHLMAALAGALFTFAFSPYDYWPVLLLASGCIFFLTQKEALRPALIRGSLFGVGLFGAGTSWVYVSIHQFGSAPAPFAILLTLLFTLFLTSIFITPLFFAYVKLRDRYNVVKTWQRALLFAGVWVLFEWIRTWFLTGFPWLLQGYALLDTPFQSWAPVVGVYGLSLLLITTACLLTSVLIDKCRLSAGQVITLMTVATAWLISLPLNQVTWTTKTGELSFSAIQGNIPQSLKWEPGYLENTIRTYFKLTEKEWGRDLVIWPENALPIFYSSARSVIQQIDRQANDSGSAFITGIPMDDNSTGEPRYYNAIIAIGTGDGRYDKQKLVPFGEYVPLESILRGLIDFFNLPMSAFSQGADNQELLEVPEATIAPYICYEVVYPDFAAEQAKDSGLLITISNDTWFGRSIGPLQHYQIARMRSLETGRYMIRTTNDGKTALIDDRGQTVKSIERFKAGILRGDVPVMKGVTPFMRFGSSPVLLLSLLMIVLVAHRSRRRA
ncbi:apolipoprotein N-acyltransferase [Endozoicomonas gorgoniicola]|uniref:Apolipoprotein N-acyltransferase n=1 Tax=Endozoicomonas gorgoniicola TaxID=1234144 RepID=A0ABT3N371_9GAMM|nr:apolipoprotein N-acyltransferase [Endozoicomonas gorgoniicola]MCW7556065.1 apolipoprotein N-acyltransferase [Endozoicomonas gorgoniicola]